MTPTNRDRIGRRRWEDLSPRARMVTLVAAPVQIGLLVAALRDLHGRTADEVNGPRWVWALISLVNFVGPLTYFAAGRRPRTRLRRDPA
jgi:hypothetical protein